METTYSKLTAGDQIRLGGTDITVEDIWLYGEDGERVSIIPVGGPERYGFWAEERVEVLA